MWHLILEHCLAVESFNIRGMTTNNGGTVYCFEDRHQKPQFLSHAHVGLTENRVMLILIVYHHLPFKHSHNWRIPHFQVPNPCRNIFLHLHIARGICRNRTAVVECVSASSMHSIAKPTESVPDSTHIQSICPSSDTYDHLSMTIYDDFPFI